MNIDTDLQYAFTEGIRDYMNEKVDYLSAQIGNPEGADQPNKKALRSKKMVTTGRTNFQTKIGSKRLKI